MICRKSQKFVFFDFNYPHSCENREGIKVLGGEEVIRKTLLTQIEIGSLVESGDLLIGPGDVNKFFILFKEGNIGIMHVYNWRDDMHFHLYSLHEHKGYSGTQRFFRKVTPEFPRI